MDDSLLSPASPSQPDEGNDGRNLVNDVKSPLLLLAFAVCFEFETSSEVKEDADREDVMDVVF